MLVHMEVPQTKYFQMENSALYKIKVVAAKDVHKKHVLQEKYQYCILMMI